MSMKRYNLGYQRDINFYRTQVYFGADLFYEYYSIKKEYKYETGFSFNHNRRKGYGIAPLLGVKLYITPAVSISTETNFRVNNYEKKETSDSDNYKNTTNSKGFGVEFNPVGMISVNVHL
jgi:hypothetical protein